MGTMGKSFLNIILISVAVTFWGLGGFFEKKGVMYGNPVMVSILIAITAFIIEVPIFLLILNKSGLSVSLNKHVVLYSFLVESCSAVASLAFLFLVRDNETAWSVSITSIYPVVTLILSSLFLKEPVTPSNMVGISVIGIGIFILNH